MRHESTRKLWWVYLLTLLAAFAAIWMSEYATVIIATVVLVLGLMVLQMIHMIYIRQEFINAELEKITTTLQRGKKSV